MTAVTPGPRTDIAADEPWRPRTRLERALDFCRRKPLGAIGLLIVLVFAIAGGFAGWIAPFDPEENDFNSMMVAPSLLHLLGTDQFGRDIFSRIVLATQVALLVGVIILAVAITIGITIGSS